MKKIFVSILFLSLILILGCQNEQDKNDVINTPLPEVIDNNIEQTQVDEFSLKLNDTFISLRDWDNEVHLEQVLGLPLSQDIEELKGDGFTGSFLKKLTYDGLEIELFSPKDNGKTFWIMTMIVSKKGYTTSKGIEVGSTVQDVNEAYPDIQIADHGRTYEVSNEQQYNYLRFEVKDSVVTQIRIFHLIP